MRKNKKKSEPISRVLCAGNPASLPSLCIQRHRSMSSDQPAVSPRFRVAGWAIHRCSALLTMRFAMPCPLPDTRWALTPPFHPYHCWRFVFCGTLCPATALTPAPHAWLTPSMRGMVSVCHRPGRYPASRPLEPGLSSTDLSIRRGSAARS